MIGPVKIKAGESLKRTWLPRPSFAASGFELWNRISRLRSTYRPCKPKKAGREVLELDRICPPLTFHSEWLLAVRPLPARSKPNTPMSPPFAFLLDFVFSTNEGLGNLFKSIAAAMADGISNWFIQDSEIPGVYLLRSNSPTLLSIRFSLSNCAGRTTGG